MDVSILFRRTQSGVAEIELNNHGLGTRARQLLVLINGSRTVADLSLLVPAIGDVRPMLLELLANGFITTNSQATVASPPAAPPPAEAPPAEPAPATEPTAPAPAAEPFQTVPVPPPPATTPPVAAPPSPAPPVAAVPAAAPAAPAFSMAALDAAKKDLLRLVRDLFGDDADPMVAKLQACNSPSELRTLTARLGGIVVSYAGNPAAEGFRVRAEEILGQIS